MIIIRSPQRISIGGGGTDLKSYYSRFGGEFISAAIDKYIYVSIIKPFKNGIYLKYSDNEKVTKIGDITHPIFREVLKKYESSNNQIEITTLADIPSGTGLGSSGSFTTALIKGLHSYRYLDISKRDLAEAACEIEIDILKEPIGKQDQYISSFGGIKQFEINKKGDVVVKNLSISQETQTNLEENLLLFFTGYTRKASSILQDQDKKTSKEDSFMLEQMHFVKEMCSNIRLALEKGDVEKFGDLLNRHWQEKKKRSENMSNDKIDQYYEIALNNGAIGGKVVGAGGGGFLLFYANDARTLRKKLSSLGLSELRFRFDFEGTKQINI
tara:strand:+ start:570 stop:1550 length:981 start_codon:yes stop_codon:yes gene_type:complete